LWWSWGGRSDHKSVVKRQWKKQQIRKPHFTDQISKQKKKKKLFNLPFLHWCTIGARHLRWFLSSPTFT
jgi:hypothetical protein